MFLFNKDNQPITSISDWKKEINPDHWKIGYSAYSLANFVLNENGLEQIKKVITEIIKEDVIIERAIPEYEVKFDDLGRGRFHDLGVFCRTTTSNKSVFVGIEAKVNETFRETISEAYLSATIKRLNGEPTNAPERIERLLKQNFGSKILDRHFDLRYQLLYATIGTLAVRSDVSFLFIIVFKTASYDEDTGNKNFSDYCCFINNVISEDIFFSIDDIKVHKLIIDNRELYSIYMYI